MSRATLCDPVGSIRRLVFAMMVPVFVLTAAPVRAVTPSPGIVALPADRDITLDPPSVSGEGMRLDRQKRLLAATAYQTVLVTSLVGGAMIVGALAGGVHPAVVAGTAVFVAYLFLPWH